MFHKIAPLWLSEFFKKYVLKRGTVISMRIMSHKTHARSVLNPDSEPIFSLKKARHTSESHLRARGN